MKIEPKVWKSGTLFYCQCPIATGRGGTEERARKHWAIARDKRIDAAKPKKGPEGPVVLPRTPTAFRAYVPPAGMREQALRAASAQPPLRSVFNKAQDVVK